jgi:hypothetical protein
MRTVRPRTPAVVKLAIVAVLVGGPAWWLMQRQDRLGNEARLSGIASAIAGRDVKVRCPGVMGRVFSWDTVEGSVRFDASGRPADETKLREFTCAELDALAEGRRPRVTGDVALAVDVLAHESWHLAGVIDEAETECRAVGSLAWTAQQLGATPEQAQRMAVHYVETGYQRLPERYRNNACEAVAALTSGG